MTLTRRKTSASSSTAMPDAEQGRLMYRVVADAILERITAGGLKPGDRLDNPPDLARKMKVGEGTIRHALQSLAAQGYVQRRPRVGTIVAAMPGDTMQTSANVPQAVRTTYALVVPDIRNPQFSNLARAVHDAADRQQIDVVTFNTDDNPKIYNGVLQRCIQNQMSGIVMVPPFDHALALRRLAELQDSAIPVVTCWRPIEAAGWPLVRGDAFEDARVAVAHLVENGYKNIGIIMRTRPQDEVAMQSGDHVIYSQTDQMLANTFNGYCRGLQDAGRAVDSGLVLNFEFNRQWISHVNVNNHPALPILERWVQEQPQMDAVVCGLDYVAALMKCALARIDKRVPEDLGLVGGGNIGMYQPVFAGTLTTTDGHFSEIGESACRLLMEMREGHVYPSGYTHIIPSRLIIGNSTERR